MEWIRTRYITQDHPEQVDSSELYTLETFWEQCQEAQKVHCEEERILSSLEEKLQAEEAMRAWIELRMLSASHLYDRGNGTSQDEDSDESTDESSQDSDYDNYLWRLGNLDLLQERYDGLISEKLKLEEEQKKRSRVGLDPESKDTEFPADFEENLKLMGREVDEVREDVGWLKQLCVEKSIIDADGNRAVGVPDSEAAQEESDLYSEKCG